MQPLYLGLDMGTSAVKAVLMNDQGALVAASSFPLSVSRPQPLWSEQDPAHWWSAVNNAVMSLDKEMRKQVRAIGLAGQMHGATLLDGTDQPLRPAILWNDGRSAAQCATLKHLVPNAEAITGNLVMPGFTAPKLLWVKEQEPEIFEEVSTVLLPKDYIRLKMTGEKATDMSDASGTSWLNVEQRRWSDDLLAACDLNSSHMPSLYEGTQVTGTLLSAVADDWGMECIPVVAGGGDNAAAGVSIAAVDPGTGFLSLGTSGVTFVPIAAYQANPAGAVHTFCHCIPALWHHMAVHLSAASCVDWGAQLLGLSSPQVFFECAEKAGASPGDELFVPYLSGERTPHNDPSARGAFFGLGYETDPGRLANAVLEGVAFAFKSGVKALTMAGTSVDSLHLVGGGSRSRYWGLILSSALQLPLSIGDPEASSPASGAARLAQIGTTGAGFSTVCAPRDIDCVMEPDADLAAKLDEKWERFSQAYEASSRLSGLRPIEKAA